MANEEKYQAVKREILGEDSDNSGESGEEDGDSDEESNSDEEETKSKCPIWIFFLVFPARC